MPAVVLDPFAGSGTTLAVARATGRRGIGIEFQAEYLPLIQARAAEAAGSLLEMHDAEPVDVQVESLSLFEGCRDELGSRLPEGSRSSVSTVAGGRAPSSTSTSCAAASMRWGVGVTLQDGAWAPATIGSVGVGYTWPKLPVHLGMARL
jgi:hypothetical protein